MVYDAHFDINDDISKYLIILLRSRMMTVSMMAKPTLLVAQSKLASTPNTRLNINRAAFSGVGRSTLSRKCVVVRAAGTYLCLVLPTCFLDRRGLLTVF